MFSKETEQTRRDEEVELTRMMIDNANEPSRFTSQSASTLDRKKFPFGIRASRNSVEVG